MNVILIRHGETPLNRARILQPPDTPLSDLGAAQAQAMADRLAGEPISAVISSDMARAAQTANPLTAALDLPVHYEPVLQERDFGELRGRRFDDLGFDPMAPDYEPPGGESWPVFHQRVAQAFECVLAHAAKTTGTLAVVSHGLVIREMIRRHLQSPVDVPDRLENTSVTIFARQAPHPTSLVGCATHLQNLTDTDANGGLV